MKRLQHNNFVYLLSGLLSMFVLMPCLRLLIATHIEVEVMRPMLFIVFGLFTMVSVWSLYRSRTIFRLGFAISILIILISVATLFFHTHLLDLGSSLLIIAFSMLNCYVAGRHVFSFQHDVDTNMLFGAVCVYLLLGLIWAMFYAVLNYIWPQGAFQGIVFDNKYWQFDSYLYFSFTTLTTDGYGDITPLNPLVRTVAYLEMIVGQFYIAILVSGLVAHFMGKKLSA